MQTVKHDVLVRGDFYRGGRDGGEPLEKVEKVEIVQKVEMVEGKLSENVVGA